MPTIDIPAGRAVAVWLLAAAAACDPLNTNTEDWLVGFEAVWSTLPARFTGAAVTALQGAQLLMKMKMKSAMI